MQVTNPKKLRAEMKDYLDAATSEPIRINRRDGSSFILLSEDTFREMQQELQSLQRRLLSMSQIIDGETKPLKRNQDRLARFKK